MPRTIQFLIALLLGALLYVFDAVSSTYSAVLALILMLLFGVPHGAVDHKIHQSTSKDRNLAKYIGKYLLISGGYVLWWFIDPAKALFIFILLSAYHFGQELLEDRKVLSGAGTLLTSMIWGAAILIGPLLFSIDEVNPYIEIVTGFSLVAIKNQVVLGAVGVIYATMLGHLIFLFQRKLVSNTDTLGLLIFMLVNLTLHLFLDFVLAFTIYFICFHSLNAFRHQFEWLAARKKDYTIRKFVLDLSLFALIAIFGIALIVFVVDPSNMNTLIFIFFMLISLITLPHAITLDHFYKVRGAN